MIYKDAPLEISKAIKTAKVIKDFLPKPDDLVLKDKTVRIMINLNKNSVDFFKKESQRLGVPYQKSSLLRNKKKGLQNRF